jgi:ketosteroid isomerase-like protein
MMRRAVLIGIVGLLGIGVAAAQEATKAAAGGKDSGGVAKTLMDMENQWAKAAKVNDADAVAALLAPDVVILDSDGSVHSKAEVVARVKNAKWVTNDISDMKVTVHGDSAIVAGSWTGNGTDGAGKKVDGKERWADTWVKMPDGKWRCVASASAPVK